MRFSRATPRNLGAFEIQSNQERQSAPNIARALILLITSFLVFALIWAAKTEMRELVRAEGEISPAGALRRVDHFDGGMVAELFVTVGSVVAANQPLARIESPGLDDQIAELEAEISSLSNEISNMEWLLDGETSGDVSRVAGAQRDLFTARQQIMKRRVDSLVEAMNIAEALRDNAKDHLSLSERSLNRLRSLHERGVISQSNLLVQAEEASSIRSEYYKADANYSKAKLDTSAANAARDESYLIFREEKLNMLHNLEREKQNIQLKLGTLIAKRGRQIVRAPESGVIQSSFATTVGEVVPQGGSLFEILPSDEQLIAVVKIDPKDVGHTQEGSSVIVNITTFDTRRFGQLQGSINLISPTSISPENVPAYYKAEVSLEKSFVGNGINTRQLRAGMTLNAEIETSKRSVLSYLLKPVQNVLSRSLTER